jgi:hypothetical protein
MSAGNIRKDALDPEHRFASMPLFIKNPDGGDGMTRRQCTSEYKLKPIKGQVRQLLGYPHPKPVPRGLHAEQWIGISRDEFGRAKDSGIGYLKRPLPAARPGRRSRRPRRLDPRRLHCATSRANGWASTPKSACIGCPFHGNAQWRALRDGNPEEWADAVDFDHAIRSGNARGNARGKPLLGEAYLHRSRLPLDQAPIDRVTAHEWGKQQTDVFGQIADIELEDGDPDGCSPWTCRSGAAVDARAQPDGHELDCTCDSDDNTHDSGCDTAARWAADGYAGTRGEPGPVNQ